MYCYYESCVEYKLVLLQDTDYSVKLIDQIKCTAAVSPLQY